MSYDLQIWATLDPAIDLALPEPERWQKDQRIWVRAGRGWQVIVGPTHRIDPDDIPDGARAALPGVQHMIEVSLEPMGAPLSAHALLRRTAKALAIAAHGAIVDHQTDTVTTPTGVRRFIKPSRVEVIDALELSWFSTNETLRTREWFDHFVGILERELPEALPVRYGPYEPPPHRFRESGRDHLINHLVTEYNNPRNLHFVVWYPQRPVLSLDLSLDFGPAPFGWTAQRITLDVEAEVLRQPGWATALQRTWRRLAHAVGVFYADARILRNQRPNGVRATDLRQMDHHPVCASFWAGIPSDGGVAVALGEPYASLWPDFVANGERDGELVFLARQDWAQRANVFEACGGVPNDLRMQSPAYATEPDMFGPNLNHVYPALWPFGPTHAAGR